MNKLIPKATLILLIACTAVAETAGAAGQPSSRVYENQLTPLANPKPLLADHPEFVQPIEEIRRFEAPPLVRDDHFW